MKYRYFLPLFLSVCLLFGSSAQAQLVVDNAFLQGQWLECAIAPNGAWGNTITVPGGYTTRGGAGGGYTDPVTGTTYTGNGMDFSFDQGHDGWTVGTPNPWYGAYFLPGTPFNGWSMQIDDTMSSAFYSSAGFDTSEYSNRGLILGGTVNGYSGPSCFNPNAPTAGTWEGRAGLRRFGLRNAMRVVQTTEIDRYASWATVTTKFYNTTDSVLKNVFYFVTGDPDNDVTVGGSFPTNNHIAYQGGPFDRHEVWGRPPVTNQDAFSGLATQDCRAKALIYQSWPPTMTPGNSLDKVWAGTTTGMGTTYYLQGATTFNQDIAYGLIYNLGNVPPHDSTFITYGWIFSDTNVVDSMLLVVPQLSTQGRVHSSGQPDTIIACTMTGCGVINDSLINVDVINGEYRNWALSKWTWTPSIGLSSSLGQHLTLNVNKLSAPVTYTITGTPEPTRGSCIVGPPVTFTLYVMPCSGAGSNSPCLYETLELYAIGDTSLTGTMYSWFGPGGYRDTGSIVTRDSIGLTDTGEYMLVRIYGTSFDTFRLRPVIRLLPIVTASSNSPVCSQNTLSLTAGSPGSGAVYTWSGPNGFASTAQNPSIGNVPVSYSGTYILTDTLDGCFDTAMITVQIDTTPAKPVVTSNSPVCSQHGTLSLRSLSPTVPVAPATIGYLWTGPMGYTSTMRDYDIPFIGMLPTLLSPIRSTGVFTVTATLGACKNDTTILVEVDSTPAPPVLTTTRVCSGTPLNFTATSMAGADYNWIGPIGYTSSFQNPTINPAITANTGTYTVTASFAYPGVTCTSDPSTIHGQVDSTAEVPFPSSNSPGFPGIAICQGDTLKLFAYDSTFGVTYDWKGPNSFTSTEQHPMILNVQPNATGTYTVVVTLGFGCVSSATTNVVINPTPPLAATSNSPVCSGSRDTLFLQAVSSPSATYKWSGPYTFSSTLQNPSRSPVLMEYDGVYQVTALVNGCFATVNDTVIINKTPDVPWMKWLTFCQFYPPDPIQAMGDNILWYSTIQTNPLVGTKTAPIANTKVVGEKYYYATQTVKGCTSYPDSIKVTVYPSPVVTVSASVAVCPRDTAILTAVNTDPIVYYHWYPSMYLSDTSSATVVVRPETNTNYFVVAKNMFGCTDTGYVSVKVKAGAVLDLGDAVTIYPGEKYQLDPATNCSFFSWFPATGLNSTRLSNPVASPLVSTKYIATGMTNQGCKVVDSIDIIVKQESVLDMPNAFVPGNGPNSTFKVVKRGIATLRNFSIFDRWGVKVFETTDIEQGWDGTYKGAPQPFGVYIYQVEAITNTGKPFNKTGNVTLIR